MRGIVVMNICFFTLLMCCCECAFFSPPVKMEVWRFENIYSGLEIAVTPTAAPPPRPENSGAAAAVLVMDSERTRRPDPLHGFQIYRGGWNLSDRHYLASAAWTSYPLLSVATLWFMGFGMCLLLLCICHFLRRRCSNAIPLLSRPLYLVLLLIFFLIAIAGCFTAYMGERKFNDEGMTAAEHMRDEAQATAGNLKAVAANIRTARGLDPFNVSLPSEVEAEIESVGSRIESSLTDLNLQMSENSERITTALHSLRTDVVVVVSLVIFLTVLGLLFSFLGVPLLGYILVVLGWIGVSVTFLYCAAFISLHMITSDGCVSIEQWLEQVPTPSTSAMNDVIPCIDSDTANRTLYLSKDVTYELVELLNAVITNISNTNFSPLLKGFYFNQSGPFLPILCNPFRLDLSPRNCSSSEIDLEAAAQVYRTWICEISDSGVCISAGRLRPADYDQLVTGINAGRDLYNDGPFLVDLTSCKYAKEGLGFVQVEGCPGLLSSGKLVYSGTGVAGVAMLLSVVLWLLYLRGIPGEGPPLGRREEGGDGQASKISTSKED